jgi:hypothetical protein
MNQIFKTLQDNDAKIANPVFIALIAVGIFIKLALSFGTSDDGSIGPANSLIWGYSIVLFSLVGIIFLNIDIGSDTWTDMKKLPWTMILTLIIIMWTISLNFKYFTPINKGTVPYQYYMWSRYSTVLVIAMIVISLTQYVLKLRKNTDSSEYARQLSMYSIIIFIFNLICVCILQIILDCFAVDG